MERRKIPRIITQKHVSVTVTVTVTVAIVLTFLVSFSVVAGEEAFSGKSDGQALLRFKKGIESDPNGVLSDWGSAKSTCYWRGVTCSSKGRVTGLYLNGSSLAGTVSLDSLGSLTMMTVLNLNSNSFALNSTSMLSLPYGLAELDLSLAGIVGPVPESLFLRCPNLVFVNLAFNNMTGFLPEKFLFSAPKLRFLDLSYNNLSGSITGMKMEVGSCEGLSEISLANNRLSGSVPPAMRNCSNVERIDVSTNFLDREIPSELGGLKSLKILDLSGNQITGWIPAEIGGLCVSLEELRLAGNNLTGDIPASLSSCSKLKVLDLSNNNVSGVIPSSLFSKLAALESVILSNNAISGPFPSSMSSCESLRVIDLSSNRISGEVPTDLCPGAAALEELRMPDNLVAGEIPGELSKCKNLKRIDLSLNYLTGSIPAELGELPKLEKLIAWFNGLDGKIPAELGKCRSLKDLILNNNQLSGEIPTELLLGCSDLEWLSLTSNRLSGDIPRQFGLMSRLAVLQLGNNTFSGEIPPELSNCTSLVWLDLNGNELAGEIPARLGRQQGSKALTGILSGNTLVFVRNVGSSCRGAGGLLEFAGIRPDRLLQVPTLKSCQFTRLYSGAVLSMFTQYQTLEYLDLSYNQLSGKIPDEFGDMIALQVMELAHNQLSGEIPWSLGKLRNLGVFDASHNRLQGEIPESFSNLSFLVEIDLSDNDLTGQIPTRGQLSTLPASQFAGNPGLCGVPLPDCQYRPSPAGDSPPPIPLRRRRRWANTAVLGALVSAASVCVAVAWAVAVRARRREAEETKMLRSLQTATTWKIEKEREPLSINVATFQRQLRKLKFSQLIEATNGFSAASLVGSGGFGEVFKATLRDGSSVAIKKLVRLSCQGDREFVAEMETLGKIKHRNLVPLLGYCKVGEERLLVYEFMDHGSLEETLHGSARSRADPLAWDRRKKIARGAAKGLCFLHHNCIPHIIHRDVKSSNVLLDSEMEARVSDFGMARLISALDTHLSVSTLAGTPGYVPPEYYQSFRCTARGDVYSFGVILLEILTGKRPTDKEDFGDTNLVGWVKMKVREGKQMEVIDEELLVSSETGEEVVSEMLRYLEVTLRCVDDFPSKRPTMLQVVAMLREITLGSGNSG